MPDEIGGAPVEGTAAPSTETPSTGGVDYSPVLSRVDELAGSIDSRFAALEQRIPAPEQPQAPDPWADLFSEEPDPAQQYAADPYQQQVQQPQGLDPNALKTAFQQAVEQANAPLVQRLAGMQLAADTEKLYADIPALRPVDPSHADYATNQQARQQTAQAVQASLQHYPQEIQHALGNDPKYIATVFKAAEAAKLAAGQAPASSEVPQLEAAGGATPGGNGEQNIAQQIFANRSTQLPSGFR